VSEYPLSCREICRDFGGRAVLHGVNLDVPRGAVLGLVGRNGAGKSTLIRVLLGLLRPHAGRSWVLGCDSLGLDDATQGRLGYVPQQPEGFSWMRVGQMLDFIGAFYPAWDGAYVDRMLTRLAISRRAGISTLSPGQRESLALIRALAARPELLVLDEPAAALDPVARRELLQEIAARTGDEGTTVLFSTHIVSDLERVASHIAVLHEGRLLVNTALDDLKETHARLIVPSTEGLPEQLPGELRRRPLGDGSLCLVITRRPQDPWPVISRSPGALLETPGLEDLFVELTR
jgi:ABC-2 type transport system ATP-binding protein